MPTYASNFKDRAWGAVKSLAYGNSTALSLKYDLRGLPTSYAVGGVKNTATEQGHTEGSSFLYQADGRVKFAGDLSAVDGVHDRAYSYDHAGRLAVAYSNAEARSFRDTGAATDTGVGPFLQAYTHDAWDNMTGFAGRYWSLPDSVSDTYDARGRNEEWEYEAAGHLISRREPAPNEWP